jgi:hypothetical protein
MTQNNKNSQKNDNEPITVVRVSGSKGTDDHVVQNIVNNNPATRFSTKGIGAFFDLEYNKEFDFNTLNLILFRGAQRKTTFSVAYTNDFKKFKPTKPATFTSAGNDSYGEYYFHDVKAKGARVSFEGHVVNSYTGQDQVIQGGQSGVQPATNPGQTTSNLGDSSADSDYFSVIGAALTHQNLTKEQEKQLKELAKASSENKEEQCDDCKCLRCGSDCNDGICENCGIKGHYEHVPISVTQVDHAIIDTTPSASQPQPLNINENNNTRQSTTVPAGAAAQAGNTVTTGIEIDKNVAEGNVPPAKDNFVGKRTSTDTRSEEKANNTRAKNNTAREVNIDNNANTQANNNNNNNFQQEADIKNRDLGPTFTTNDPQANNNNNNNNNVSQSTGAFAAADNKYNNNNNKNQGIQQGDEPDQRKTANADKKKVSSSNNIKEGDTVETETTIVDKKDVQ